MPKRLRPESRDGLLFDQSGKTDEVRESQKSGRASEAGRSMPSSLDREADRQLGAHPSDKSWTATSQTKQQPRAVRKRP